VQLDTVDTCFSSERGGGNRGEIKLSEARGEERGGGGSLPSRSAVVLAWSFSSSLSLSMKRDGGRVRRLLRRCDRVMKSVVWWWPPCRVVVGGVAVEWEGERGGVRVWQHTD
jgi:hypothetical protein